MVPSVVGATPARPTLAQVKAKLDKLARQNEVLAEQYNKAMAEVTADQQTARAAQREALATASDFDNARASLRQTVTAAYESASFSHVGALLRSKDGQSYLDILETLSLISSHRAAILSHIQTMRARAATAQKQADTLLTAAQTKAATLDKQRRKIEADTKTFTDLLATLTAAQRAAYARRNTVLPATARAVIKQAPPAPAPPAGTTSAAQRAVDYAINQVGKGYVFAGTGPDAFDCSGLTMMSWAQGGITLPHQSAEQYNFGTHVSASDLRPGDLVFMYRPISHVEIMVGPDLAVSAANEALGVRYVHPSQEMPNFAGATRLT